MGRSLRVLLVEDVEEDALLVVRELGRGGFDVSFERVDTRAAMSAALEKQTWDAVISDYAMPQFSAPMALALVREKNLDLPFIIVSGTVDEVIAVEAMKAGAHDFMSKERLARLNSALERELREVAQRARQSHTRGTLDAIVESAPANVVVLDENGRIRFANRVIGKAKKEILDSDWLEHVAPEERGPLRARLQRVLETGVLESYETSMQGLDGSTVWLRSYMGAMRHGARIAGAVVVSHDVTELKRTQSDAAEAQRLAAVGTLAAGVAHEINTPVQFVNDSVHFLRDASRDLFDLLAKLQEVRRLAEGQAPAAELAAAIGAAAAAEDDADLGYLRENVPKAVERCIEGLERVRTIVRSMKEFAHPAQEEMAQADLNRAIETTITVSRNEYKYVANVEAELGDLPLVTCLVNDINQVVLNLIVNAANAIATVVEGTEAKGTIRVRTRQDRGHVVISIADTGTGIPEAVAARIFEPFFTTKEVGKGTGQGLALAWNIVKEKHGGELTFETRVGAGTTFFVRLPIDGKRTSGART